MMGLWGTTSPSYTPSMAPTQSQPFGNLLNPQPGGSHAPGDHQTPAMSTYLRGLNNHADLVSPQRQLCVPDGPCTGNPRSLIGSASRETLASVGTRPRPKVKAKTTLAAKSLADHVSPTRGPSKKRQRSRSPTQAPAGGSALTSQQSSLAHDSRPESQLASGVPAQLSRDLTRQEADFLAELTESFDDKHRHEAEIVGENHRHLARSADSARAQYYITQTADKVESLVHTFEDQLRAVHDDLSTKINLLSENLRDLTKAIQTDGLAVRQSDAPPAVPARNASNGEPPKRKKWVLSKELRALVTALSVELLPEANLQAYTAIEDGAKNYLPRSLFNTIRATKQDAPWLAQHLPGKIRGVNDAKGIRNYCTAIKEACKHSREKLHLLLWPSQLLTNIQSQKSRTVKVVAVPTLQALWYRVAIKCGIINESVDPKTAWAAAAGPARSRLTYLQREAARLRKTPSNTNIWCEVDAQLDHLRQMDQEHPDFSSLFYDYIYQNDREIFDGKRSWSAISSGYVLELSTDEVVLNRVAAGPMEEEQEEQSEVLGEEMEDTDDV
ncbi:uncharacterized protein MELLADRAFT_94328 [Melampsora larici-populina 98AG31]|uniref:Uncharacterized protein n=1 Tax=Melampsora larici-populina (strain 98AG31 / pathotype 3-4-7) TaxID=747676 RepID=F4S7B4_MELLP|nr:uncharacterized protein MELLADRAFT_94328 [Melampsora larici-populina 98AG31]EGF99489.1 hypothetical protein MELLADRAFT_94328 [Melampsora larici-populina 98AG31]